MPLTHFHPINTKTQGFKKLSELKKKKKRKNVGGKLVSCKKDGRKEEKKERRTRERKGESGEEGQAGGGQLPLLSPFTAYLQGALGLQLAHKLAG